MSVDTRRCLACGYTGEMKTWLQHHSAPQAILIACLMFYVVPGLIFIAWGWGKYKCPKCGALDKNIPGGFAQPEPDYYKPGIFNPSPENTNIMMALAFMGRADGQLREPESVIIANYLKNEQPEHGDTSDNYLCEQIRKLKKLTSAEYKQIISQANPAQIKKLMLWSGKIISTQKSVHPFEEYLMEELAAKLTAKDQDYTTDADGIRVYNVN